MGNELTTSSPPQILTIRQYIDELKDYEYFFKERLGDTRFLKVGRALNSLRNYVVKVFQIPVLPVNPGRTDDMKMISLENYSDQIIYESDKLKFCENCLPFHEIIVKDKVGYIIRRFCKYNLYDRLSTRPFLNEIERRWIAFGILLALKQAHANNVVHGDIKSQNVLLSSSNHVYLSDWSSEYKPNSLPDDNPSDFTFFFDTSRSRTCYLAPERFVRRNNYPDTITENDGNKNKVDDDRYKRKSKLSTKVDIFSAGCVFIELFTDGQIPFNLSKLLKFRQHIYNPNEILDKIEDEQVRNLVKSMINISEDERLSAEEYLDKERGKIFPNSFYDFLPEYIRSLPTYPDDRLNMINKDFDELIMKNIEVDCLILCIPLVTSCIRLTESVTSKLSTLSFLKKISKYLPSDLVLDRVIPFSLYFLHDNASQVRMEAIYVTAECIENCESSPDCNVMPNYILFKLKEIVNDEAPIVRLTLAKCLHSFADNSLRFLNCAADMDDKLQYDIELSTIRDIIGTISINLLRDSQQEVRQMIAGSGVAKLCLTLGRKLISDVLLLHFIPLLNERQWRTKIVFFKSLIPLVTFIGVHINDAISSLIISGITDIETFVIVEALQSTAVLIEEKLLKKQTIIKLVKDLVVPLLQHPSLCIRYAACCFICAVCHTLHLADVHCFIYPMIKKKLISDSIVFVENELLLLRMLKTPLSREAFEQVQKSADSNKLIDGLFTKKFLHMINVKEKENMVERTLLRLSTLTDDSKQAIIDMKPFFVKPSVDLMTSSLDECGKVKLNDIPKAYTRQIVLCPLNQNKKAVYSEGLGIRNEDWTKMFGSTDGINVESRPLRTTPIEENKFEIDQVNGARASCKSDLCNLLKSRQRQLLNSGILLSNEVKLDRRTPKDWQPKGLLVGHTHEHREAINAVSVNSNSTCFVSASDDGSIRLWKSSRIANSMTSGTTIRSQTSYLQSGKIKNLAFSNDEQFASISNSGNLHIVNITNESLKCKKIYDVKLDLTDGVMTDLIYLPSCQVYAVSTAYGYLKAYDCRTSKSVFNLEQNPELGLITTISPSLYGEWWLATGTSKSTVVIWDLRFKLPVSQETTNTKMALKKIIPHPVNRAEIAIAAGVNNEVSIWKLQPWTRLSMLWASVAAPLSTSHHNKHCVNGFFMDTNEQDELYALTGGTDMRLRYWNFNRAEMSTIFARAGSDKPKKNDFSYMKKTVEGVQCTIETYNNNDEENSSSIPTIESPPLGHHDIVTDITACRIKDCRDNDHYLILSSSRDGVLKIWK